MSFPRLSLQYDSRVIPYTGSELRPHYLLEKFKVRGSGLVLFQGPCEVATDNLVDWEDRLENDFIKSKLMLHCLGEFFGFGLREGVLLQRWIMGTFKEALETLGVRVEREGDDLFIRGDRSPGRKLSVSIVTASPVSILLHCGINVDPEGAPVAAVGLGELGIQPERLVSAFFEKISKDWDRMDWACTKVRPVME